VMADRVIFVFIIVLAAVYFYATAQIPTLEIGDPLGPKAFPQLLGIALLITGAMLFVEILRARRGKDGQAKESPPFDRAQIRVVGAVTVWTFAYFLVFEPLGYVIASALYLLPLMAYFNRGKWTANVLTAVLFSLLSYVLFTHVLGVTLARGILPF
jgi:putative tricarboxylic transport membrane protein